MFSKKPKKETDIFEEKDFKNVELKEEKEEKKEQKTEINSEFENQFSKEFDDYLDEDNVNNVTETETETDVKKEIEVGEIEADFKQDIKEKSFAEKKSEEKPKRRSTKLIIKGAMFLGFVDFVIPTAVTQLFQISTGKKIDPAEVQMSDEQFEMLEPFADKFCKDYLRNVNPTYVLFGGMALFYFSNTLSAYQIAKSKGFKYKKPMSARQKEAQKESWWKRKFRR